MDLGPKHKKAKIREAEDRISSLPNDLIHLILSFIDINEAVQTCILSRRWCRVWATLPYLTFHRSKFHIMSDFCNFVSKFLSKRNQYADISTVDLCFGGIFNNTDKNNSELIKKVVTYAISYNVQQLRISGCKGITNIPPRIFSSSSLKILELQFVDEWICDDSPQSMWSLRALTSLQLHNCTSTLDLPWSFPSLTTLNLQGCKLSPMYWDIPALTTLHLQDCELPVMPWSLPALTTLHLWYCDLPLMSWSLPALTTLLLHQFTSQVNKNLSFQQFVNLKNLALTGCRMWSDFEVISITSLSLANLTISFSHWDMVCPPPSKIVVSAPNLSSFDYNGSYPLLFSADDGLPSLEKVNIDICIPNYMWKTYLEEKKQMISQNLFFMFHELRGAKFLTLSSLTIEVLSRVPDFSEHGPSPFFNLKCFKLKEIREYANSTIPSHVRIYFLSNSPSANIVIEDWYGISGDYKDISLDGEETSSGEVNSTGEEEQNKIIGHIEATVVHDTMDEQVGADHVSQDAILVQQEKIVDVMKRISGQVNAMNNIQDIGDAVKVVTRVVPSDTVQGGVPDQAGFCRENNNFALWKGHQVYSHFVDLLQHISEKYPETFEHFAPKTENIYTVGLNTLCTSVTAFSELSTAKFTASIITHYRCLFSDLEICGFNISWLVNSLNNADEVCAIDCRLDDAQKEVQKLQALRVTKLAEIQEAVGHLRTNLAAATRR